MNRSLLRLVRIFGAGNPVIHKVIEYYGNAENACAELDKGDIRFLADKQQREMVSFVTDDKIDKVILWCEKRDIKLVNLYENEYPGMLREIYNPPVVLFYCGDLSCLERTTVTAVGAREITPYIEKLSFRICRDLSAMGITLVSGMAKGVDSVVHNACIHEGNPTVGVLACGINYDYPFGSVELRRKIVLNGGAYITELFPEISPSREYFRGRNRILAGLSAGTIVFQAGAKSGSLITAGYALEEGRDVFCVPPPNLLDKRYNGVIPYLEDGAIPVFNHDDIIEFYKRNY